VTSFSYDARKRQLVSYDTPHIAALKAKYVQANGLAGSMFWEVCRPRPRFSRRGSTTLKYLAVSCPWIRKDPPRLSVLPPGYTVALTRHQYVLRRLRRSHYQSDPFFDFPESYTVKHHRRHHLVLHKRIIDDRTAIPIVNGTISATTWVRIHPPLHLLNRHLPLLPQAREIVQAWRCGVLQ
jgi:hypothetical protein